jgi:antitoxin PrlF
MSKASALLFAQHRRFAMPVVEEISTITAKGQTTVPKAVRQALGVRYGGRIAFRVEHGLVTVRALPEADDADPALAPFLSLLERDLAARAAEAVRPFPPALADRLEAIATEIKDMDLDAPIEGDVSL